MKNFSLLLVFFFIFNGSAVGQKADVSCGSPYPKLNFGYVNYNDNNLGRVFKITYKTNFLGNKAIITNIDVIGNIKVNVSNITTSNVADSLISNIGSSSAVNINLSAIPADVSSSVTANIKNEVTNNLSVLMVGQREMSINKINDLTPSIDSLQLPNLNKKEKIFYAICNQVHVANKLLVGLKKGKLFSLDLTVDVPKTVSASGKLNINMACTNLAMFKGNNKLAFYNFTPIDSHGIILNNITNKAILQGITKGIDIKVPNKKTNTDIVLVDKLLDD